MLIPCPWCWPPPSFQSLLSITKLLPQLPCSLSCAAWVIGYCCRCMPSYLRNLIFTANRQHIPSAVGAFPPLSTHCGYLNNCLNWKAIATGPRPDVRLKFQ